MLKDKISKIISFAHAVAVNGIAKDPDYVEKYIIKQEMNKMIEEDFMIKNPEEMIEEYTEYVETLNLMNYNIKKGRSFFRARVGCEVLKGSVDDYSRDFIIPYHEGDISAPPPLFSSGARFNEAGTSYLYLADNIDTCIAEIHAQINQICSVGTFESVDDINLVDLRKADGLEAEVIIGLLTQPVNSDNIHRYNITRFFSEILRKINPNGIVFESVQSTGNNIVCFNKKLFKSVKFSEKIYRVKKIKYEIEGVDGAVEEFSNKKDRDYGSILEINDEVEEVRKRKFDYFCEWIDFVRNNHK